MAWTIHRSCRRLARRQTASSTTLFLWTTPMVASTPFLVSNRQQQGLSFMRKETPKRSFSNHVQFSNRPSPLYSYRDFLGQNEHETIQVSYFTDIEGDKLYLDRYVDNSKILRWIDCPAEKEKDSSAFSYFQHPENECHFPYHRRIDFVDSSSMLVFGGDLWDKGGFDLYVTRQLLDLKRRYPQRVLWVLGNRDINKLRILQELGFPSSGEVSVPYHPGLMWFRNSGRVGDPNGPLPSMDPGERLRWILGNTMGSPDAMEHRRQELAWEAGGCKEDFLLSNDTKDVISRIPDEDIVRSYQESCHPRGEMGRFLSEGLLAAKVGPILFVHGSLPLTNATMEDARAQKVTHADHSIWDDLTFCMPWMNKTYHNHEDIVFQSALEAGVKTIEDWLAALNDFCVRNVDAWKQDIARMESKGNNQDHDASKESIWAYRGGYGNGPSHEGIYYSDLVQYGMGMIPGGQKNPTVVYNSFTPEGMPTFFLPENETSEEYSSEVAVCTSEFFAKSSLQLILTGHKPQGDMPSPIRVGEESWVICADTSYSGDTKWFHDENNRTSFDVLETRQKQEEEAILKRENLGRGIARSFRGDTAVSEVLVHLCGRTLRLKSVKYHGVLSDGTEYESINLLDTPRGGLDGYNGTMSAGSMGKVAPTHMVPQPSDSPHEGRWWTKGICKDGSHLYYAGEGYDVWNYIVPPPEATVSLNSKEDPTNE